MPDELLAGWPRSCSLGCPVTGKNKALLTAAGLGAGLAVRSLIGHKREENLTGQVVLITGGSKGLGIALARRFAAEGCRLAITARNREELHGAKRELERRGAQVFSTTCDVTVEAQVKQMIGEVEAHFGRIDILVNNAGQIEVGPLTTMTVKDFDSAMNVMFWGTVFPTLALIPEMVKRHSGKIVNITSLGGKVSVPHMVPYTCAKFAATGFSEGLRAEMLPEGVQVTTIVPGLLRTGSFLNAMFKGNQEEEARWFSAGASMPGLTMTADAAAKQIVTAVKRGEAERILTGGAKALSTFHDLFPGAASDLAGLIAAALLPVATGVTSSKPGSRLSSLKTPAMKFLLTLGKSAAQRYRQNPA
jgi:short-subunit dehydrogenase